MTIDTKKLRELAEAATPGPWECRTPGVPDAQSTLVLYTQRFSHDRDEWRPVTNTNKPRDAACIAAANPQTVIELLDEIERLTKGQEGLAAAWTAALADNDEAREQLRKAEAMKECDCQGVGHAPWCRIVTAAFKHKTDGDLARSALEATKRECEKLRDQLAAMTAARDEACDLAAEYAADAYNAHPATIRDKERIADLRKVGAL